SQRRAAALTMLAHEALTSGRLQPSARIRPHLNIHIPWTTLQALITATPTAQPTDQAGPGDLGWLTGANHGTHSPTNSTSSTGSTGGTSGTGSTGGTGGTGGTGD